MNKKALFVVLIFSAFSFSGQFHYRNYSTSYWLWAGITAQDAPPNFELYILQGNVSFKNNKTSFEHLGLYPHPLTCEKLFLVYRIDGQLPDAKELVDIFSRHVLQWQRHKIKVSGIQLDYDSPTSKLVEYSHFLESIRTNLPKKYALSITGLGDWVTGDSQDVMNRISSSVNDIVFQLYQGREHLQDIDMYIEMLSDYPHPFRIGLISGHKIPSSIDKLKRNSRFLGTIYFIQR